MTNIQTVYLIFFQVHSETLYREIFYSLILCRYFSLHCHVSYKNSLQMQMENRFFMIFQASTLLWRPVILGQLNSTGKISVILSGIFSEQVIQDSHSHAIYSLVLAFSYLHFLWFIAFSFSSINYSSSVIYSKISQ